MTANCTLYIVLIVYFVCSWEVCVWRWAWCWKMDQNYVKLNVFRINWIIVFVIVYKLSVILLNKTNELVKFAAIPESKSGVYRHWERASSPVKFSKEWKITWSRKGLTQRRPDFRLSPVLVRFVVDKVGLRHGFLRILVCFVFSIIPWMRPIHSLIHDRFCVILAVYSVV